MNTKTTFILILVLISIPLLSQNQSTNVFLTQKFLNYQTKVPVFGQGNQALIKQMGNKNINDIVFDKVLAGKVPVYKISGAYDLFPYDITVTDTITTIELIAELSTYQADNKPNIEQIKYYNFVEEWIFDADAFVFEKKVVAYQAVREYLVDNDGDEMQTRRKPVITILNPENINPSATKPLLQIKTEFKFDYPEDNMPDVYNYKIEKLADEGILFEHRNAPYWNSMIRNKLVNSVFDRVLGNLIPVFDSNNGTYIPLSELKTRVGFGVDTILIEGEEGQPIEKTIDRVFDPNSIKSMYLIENWFINPDNLNFRKEVEAIEPERYYLKNWDDTINSKQIVGRIYFDNENKERLEHIYNQLVKKGNTQNSMDGLELFTNMLSQSKNQNFKVLCKEKCTMLLNFIKKQGIDDVYIPKLDQLSKKINQSK